ncbi:nitrilase-related carbon-nitrogen hydrolase [Roseiconus lacunae]|uniref:nitrilase-related carbon-nitrogen hydrolase n=1 Tax=Roseiconus lacunae TaxID=2605694 RepID=UPI003314FF04
MNGEEWSPHHRFCLAVTQSSFKKGEISENIRRHSRLVYCTAADGARVISFSELSITGYEPTVAAETANDTGNQRFDSLQGLSDRRYVTIVAGCPIRLEEAEPFIGAFSIRPELPIEFCQKQAIHPEEFSWFIPSDDVAVYQSHWHEIGVAFCADIGHPVHAVDTFQKLGNSCAVDATDFSECDSPAVYDLAKHARIYRFPTTRENYVAESGRLPTGGRNTIREGHWNVIAQMPRSGECVVITEANPEGWREQLISFRD